MTSMWTIRLHLNIHFALFYFFFFKPTSPLPRQSPSRSPIPRTTIAYENTIFPLTMAPAKLPTRQLGANGPHVTALGFGLMGLSSFYGVTETDEERFKILDAAYEAGETNWDSADMCVPISIASPPLPRSFKDPTLLDPRRKIRIRY